MPVARFWPHLRAALVAFHLVAITLIAIPAPDGGMDRSQWHDPTVQAEFAVWSGWMHMNPHDFEAWVWNLALGYMRVREKVLAPFIPYLDASGCWQPWRLFVAPHRFPGRYQVQVLPTRGGPTAWLTVFEERSPTATWHAPLFEHERLRSALFRYEWPQFTPDARRLCEYLAAQLFAERRDIEAVRCRFDRVRTPSPDEVLAHREPTGEWVQTLVVTREQSEVPR